MLKIVTQNYEYKVARSYLKWFYDFISMAGWFVALQNRLKRNTCRACYGIFDVLLKELNQHRDNLYHLIVELSCALEIFRFKQKFNTLIHI